MEPTSGRRVHGIRNLAPRQHLPPASHRVWNRYGLQEGLRVWMLRVGVDPLRGAHLDDSAQVHDRDSVTDEFRGRQVVCDKEVRGAIPAFQVQHQFENPGANRHVEHRDRLVCDDQLWLQDHRPGDYRPLLLASTEVRRILPVHLFRWRKADLGHDLQRSPLRLFLICRFVDDERVRDALTNRHPWVQRRVRILEDDLHSLPERPEFPFLQVRDVRPLEADCARGGLNESKDRPTDGRFPASAFSDEPENLAAAQRERNAVDRVDGEVATPKNPCDSGELHGEMFDKILHLQDRVGHRKSFPKWQAAKCPGRYSTHAGSSVRQISWAYVHRG